MKIAFVTHRLSHSGGGVSAVVESLSAELGRRITDIRVLGLADHLWSSEKANWTGANVEAFSIVGPNALGWSPQLHYSLSIDAPDLLHSHGIWMATSAQVASWGRKWRRPYIVSPHGMLEPQALAISPWKKRAARCMFENSHLSGAVCIHALNAAERDHIRAFGLRKPIAVLPNGVALPSRLSVSGQPPWGQQFPRGARILLFLGRLHPKKNIASLIKSLGELKQSKQLGDWRLAVAGWGPAGYLEEIKNLTVDLNLRNEIAFLGPLFGKDKDAALEQAAGFVLPSLSEGLPMAILEAWAYGLPVVMTSACNLPQGFETGAALEIQTGSNCMAGALAEFFALPNSELKKMGEAGRVLVEQHYSWEAVADSFVQLYNWILGGGDRPNFIID